MLTDIQTAFFIARKSITRGNKSTLALIGFILTLSYLNMMFIIGIMSGMTAGMIDMMINTGFGHISISPQEEPTRREFIENQTQLRAQIETIPGVIGTASRYQLGATVAHDPKGDGIYKIVSAPIVALDPDVEKELFIIHEGLIEGEYLDGLSDDEILLPSFVAGGYDLSLGFDLGGARPGDKVHLTYASGLERTYTVKGILEIAGAAEVSLIINRKEAESVLSVYDSAHEILVLADLSRYPLESYAARIRDIAPRLHVQTYEERLVAINTFLSAFDLISYIVGTISIIVAAITIFVMIYVNAISRRRQIGILKAIGIKTGIIELSYVFQSLFYALCGVLLGAGVTFLILYPALFAHPLSLGFGLNISLSYTPTAVAVGIVSLLLAGLLAGFVPARIVARQDILKAIWG